MPVFRIPRAHLEVEVSQLEAQGFRGMTFTPDGDHVIVYANPQWTSRASVVEIRPVLERTELGQHA